MLITQVVASDFHVPYHDPKLLGLFVDFCDVTQPDEIHLLGDYQNCGSLSLKFADAAKDLRDQRIAWEISVGKSILERLRDRFKKTRIVYHDGNHEHRLDRYVRTHARVLQGLKGLTVPELLGLSDLKMEYHEYGTFVKCGKLGLTHGDIVRTGSGTSARAMLQKWGQSVLFGHTHRLGAVYRTNGVDTSGAWENGCMCLLDQPYTHGPTDWQQGWSIVYNDMKSRFNVVQVPVVNHRYIFEGKEYPNGCKANASFCAGLPRASF